MIRTTRLLAGTSSYLAAILSVVASVVACVQLLSPLARAVNCFQPRESTWVHALESVGWSVGAMLGAILALVLGKRAASTSGVRALILWCEVVLGALLVVPILFLTGPVSESGAESRAECGLTVAGSAAVAGMLFVPAVVASLPVLLSFSRLRAASANLVAIAATISIWAAVFMAIRPWEYPGW